MKSIIAMLVLSVVAPASPYDPVKLLPDSYSLQFENEWVKVVRVRYAPHAKLPPHAHTSRASAYVYLNDAGPVIFRHVGEKTFAATRPATKAGSFRVFRGIEEIHEVENTSDLPSEFLRVEFKTEPRDVGSLRGRFAREQVPAGENRQTVQFENAQVRITRVTCAAGKAVPLTAADAEPALLIDLTRAIGKEDWMPARRTHTLRNEGATPLEMLRFDLKTPPAR